jgi:hypothetical protein
MLTRYYLANSGSVSERRPKLCQMVTVSITYLIAAKEEYNVFITIP